MWKKKKAQCLHKWKDFGVSGKVDIEEPFYYKGKITVTRYYACMWCREKKTVDFVDEFSSKKECESKVERYNKSCSPEDRALILLRISDFQLLDPEYLELARKLYPDRGL